MNGPTYSIEFERGKSYKLPAGYQYSTNIFSGEYLYKDGIFIKPFSVNSKEYLLFSTKEGYEAVLPHFNMYENSIRIYLNPVVNGNTEEQMIENLKTHLVGKIKI